MKVETKDGSVFDVFTDSRSALDFDLGTREGMLGLVRSIGEYISDNAENILGEYPSGLCGFDVTAHFRFDAYPTVEIRREHVLTARGGEHSGQQSGSDVAKEIIQSLTTRGICGEGRSSRQPRN